MLNKEVLEISLGQHCYVRNVSITVPKAEHEAAIFVKAYFLISK